MKLVSLSKKIFSIFKLSVIKFTNKVILINDFKFIVPKDMNWAFNSGDYYESNVIYFLDKLFNEIKRPNFIDIGANYGYFSMRYASKSNSIISFEPVKRSYDILHANVQLNKFQNVFCYRLGLSNFEMDTFINIYNSSGNNSIYIRKIPQEHQLKQIGKEKINLVTLDTFFLKSKCKNRPDIMKIDVEGAELEVLIGSSEIIVKNRPIILVEYSETTSNDAGYEKVRILEFFSDKNYKAYGIPEDPTLFKIIIENDILSQPIGNLILMPNEKNYFKW
jgi:FkbM family methyltransferase